MTEDLELLKALNSAAEYLLEVGEISEYNEVILQIEELEKKLGFFNEKDE
jgi:hypothetical protein